MKDGIQNAQLILITSQEIDELGESRQHRPGPAADGRRAEPLRRGVRVLADHGIKTIVLVADHGHLFADEIGEDMKIEAPGGKTADLHRRVWVGVGGTSEPSYLRTSLASLGRRQRLRHRHPVDLRLLQVEGRRASLLPRRAVAPGVDRPRGRADTRRPRPAAADDRHPMDAHPRHGEADHAVLLRADRRERRASRACSGSSRRRCGSNSGPTRSASRSR